MAQTDYYTRPYELVRGQIDDMSSRADNAIATANETISQLKDIASLPETMPPPAPQLEFDVTDAGSPQAPTILNFGDIDDFDEPAIQQIPTTSLSADAIPTFTSSVGTITLPPRPDAIDTTGKPDRPARSVITVPNAPTLAIPTLDALQPITIPEFTFPELPTFDRQAPANDLVAPSTLLIWAEPEYLSDNLDAIKARVAVLLSGGTGLPLAVEAALFDRARGREDMLALKARQEAFDSFAARGFTMPPGMLAAQVNAAIEDNQLKVGAINRDILNQAAQWEIENLRFAVQQGIALESTLIAQFQNIAQRAFEAARYRVEAEVNLFNARVALFNAEQNAYQIAASVYKTRLEGALAELDVFKAEIQAQQAIGQLNEQTVRVFIAKNEALRSQIEVYKTSMEGARVQSELNRNEIEAYKADISAYAENIQAQKVEFDAYESEVRAIAAKTGIIDAEARAFAATVQAYESGSNIKVKNLQVQIEAMQAGTSRYAARAQAERDKIAAQASAVQARSSAYSADVGRYSAELQSVTSRQESRWRQTEARLRNNLAYYDIQVKQFDQKLDRSLRETQTNVEAIKAAGQMAAQLAAGAMSAMHVSASMSGSAGVSSSESFS
ncbi:MAG: hypothetical protein ACRDAM_00245, partial [Casimicrobium sp.]